MERPLLQNVNNIFASVLDGIELWEIEGFG
jgi:hypothetical protein